MSTSARLSPERRKEVARLVARHLASKGPFLLEEAPVSLAESLPLFVLDVSANSRASRIAQAAKDTSAWHHQLKQGGSATLVARTLEDTAERATDLWLAWTGLGQKIDLAIAWADSHVGDEWEARLLHVPTLAAYCLWFEHGDEERIYVIDCPPAVIGEGAKISAAQLLELAILAARGWGPLDLDDVSRTP